MRAMRAASRLLTRLKRSDDGATAIEYALIAVGLSLAITITVAGVGANLRTNFYEKVQAATTN